VAGKTPREVIPEEAFMTKITGKISRRKFLSSSASFLTTTGLFGLPRQHCSLNSLADQSQVTEKKILCRTLGKTGMKLPVVNMGVMNSFNPALVQSSYEIGIRYFDTAAYYGRGENERMLGRVFKEMNVRDNVFIGTKIFIPHQQRRMPPNEAKGFFLKTAEESLKRLQTDYIDILFSHNVQTPEYLNNPGILEALEILKEQKKARFIGFSTHTNMTELFKEAVQTDTYDVILTAFNYAMEGDDNLMNALRAAAGKGLGLIAMKTQCTQYWYREYVPPASQKYYQGKILHTAVLKWALRHGFVTTAIPGFTTFQQMEEDFSVAYDLEYTPEERQFLQDRNIKNQLGYCLQCNQCLNSCPMRVDIPALMRTHMYISCYNNYVHAKQTLEETPREQSLLICNQCTECTAQCVNHIPVKKRIDELKMFYG